MAGHLPCRALNVKFLELKAFQPQRQRRPFSYNLEVSICGVEAEVGAWGLPGWGGAQKVGIDWFTWQEMADWDPTRKVKTWDFSGFSSCFWLVFPVIFGFVVKQGGFFISLPNHYPSHPIFRQSYPIQSIFLGFRKIWWRFTPTSSVWQWWNARLKPHLPAVRDYSLVQGCSSSE